jgi:hypothetical protein
MLAFSRRFLLPVLGLFALSCSLAQAEQRQSRSLIHPATEAPELSAVTPDVSGPLLTDVVPRFAPDRAGAVLPRSGGYLGSYPNDLRVANILVTPRSDFDGDGYYSAFRLQLNVDADGRIEWVYLKLYVSYQGGPWHIVHRSGDFRLSWSLFSNEIALTTVLDSGYPRGFYDLRIDLFDADTGRWLRSLGPYDDADLSSVPLEDRLRDRDAAYIDGSLNYDIGVYGSGSTGAGGLLLLLVVAALRRIIAFSKAT